MASITICDGCTAVIESGPERIGLVLARDYCPDCAAKVREYGGELDTLHDKCAKAWSGGLARLRAKYEKRLKRLPDVPGDG